MISLIIGINHYIYIYIYIYIIAITHNIYNNNQQELWYLQQ